MTFTAQEEPAPRVVSPHVLLTANPAVAAKVSASTGELLVFARVRAWVEALPTTTFPKLIAVGVAASCGCVPTPEIGSVSG